MPKDNQKQMSEKEIAKKTLGLEAYMLSAGISHLRSDNAQYKYGSLAVNSARLNDLTSKLLDNSFFKEKRDKINKQYQEDAKQMGYNGETPKDSDSVLLMKFYQGTRESLQTIALGDLEKIIKDNGGKLEVEVPEQLKDVSVKDFSKYIHESVMDEQGNVDESKIDKKYAGIQQISGLLTKAYDISCGKKLIKDTDYFKEVNEGLKSVIEQYNKLNPKAPTK